MIEDFQLLARLERQSARASQLRRRWLAVQNHLFSPLARMPRGGQARIRRILAELLRQIRQCDSSDATPSPSPIESSRHTTIVQDA